jgi:hypothetical protein
MPFIIHNGLHRRKQVGRWESEPVGSPFRSRSHLATGTTGFTLYSQPADGFFQSSRGRRPLAAVRFVRF